MSNFVVSARKYRPAKFEEVVGQEHVGQTLKNALKNDHLAHAFLFCGPRGVGKTTCARILAKVLNCENSGESQEPCGTCDSCKSFDGNASFNIMELDAASNNSVEHIRTLVEQVRFQPQQGKYKIFIIDEVHMLSQSAFNAFLKTLEEPPPYAIFILATTEKHKIIPTILSRCQIFDFKRIQIPQMIAHLENICNQEGIEADTDALHIIAQKADGALRDALSIFDRIVSFSGKKIVYEDVINNLNILDYDYYFKFTEAIMTGNLPAVMTIFDEILRNGFEGDIFLNGLGEHFRNLLVCRDEATLKLLEVSEGLKNRYKEQARLAKTSFLLTGLNLVNDCDINFKMARNKRLHVEMTLIKMTHIGQAVELAKNPVAIPEKKKIEGSNPAVAPTPDRTPPAPTTPKVEEPTPSAPQAVSPPKREEVPAPVAQREPEATEKRPPVGGLGKSSKHNTFKLSSLDELEEEIEQEEANGTVEEAVELTIENVRPIWEKYLESVDQMSVKSILKSAEIKVQGDKVQLVVGSTLAENTIRQEIGLMGYLRTELKNIALIIEIVIDPERAMAKQAPKKPKPMTDSEKYWHMKNVNPLVDEVRKRFDLKFEQD